MAQELSEVFYTFLITSVIGFILGLARVCYKSKCENVDVCCIKIKRNVIVEEHEDMAQINKKEENDEKI